MGLDMYLEGRKRKWNFGKDASKPEFEDGHEVLYKILELGYWRKHPNLHGYIVNTFADGVDECQEISLSVKDLEQTVAAIKAKDLPDTKGFFFGESDGSEDEESIRILEKAIEWVQAAGDNESRSVSYRASW